MNEWKSGRPQQAEYAPYAQKYVELVCSDDVMMELSSQIVYTISLVEPLGDARASEPYGPGKWTYKEVIGHLTDAERIFGYRMLRIARADATALSSFDQDDYVRAAKSNERPLGDLLEEFRVVRQSTLLLLSSLPVEAWVRSSCVSGHVQTLRGIAFVTAGHECHHQKILKQSLAVGGLTNGTA